MNDDNKVLACVDASRFAPVVADYAAWAARRLAAPLEFLHVIDPHPPLGPGQDHSGAIGLGAQEHLLHELASQDEARGRAQREAGRRFLNELRERAVAQGLAAVDVRQRRGELAETLAQQQDGARLLVMGRRGVSHEGALQGLGSQLEWVVRSLRRPVLAVGDGFTEPTGAVMAFDGSALARRGVQAIAASPLLRGLPLHLVMAGQASARGPQQLAEAMDTLQAAGFSTTREILRGEAAQVIPRALAQHGANLLVMGAYSHSPLHSLFGRSKTRALLEATAVPTLLLR